MLRSMSDPVQLVTIAIQELPAVISAFVSLFRSRNPDVPLPTSEQIIAAYQSAYLSSVAKDELWLAQHPDTPPVSPSVIVWGT